LATHGRRSGESARGRAPGRAPGVEIMQGPCGSTAMTGDGELPGTKVVRSS
jgi:hypothetical protein